VTVQSFTYWQAPTPSPEELVAHEGEVVARLEGLHLGPPQRGVRLPRKDRARFMSVGAFAAADAQSSSVQAAVHGGRSKDWVSKRPAIAGDAGDDADADADADANADHKEPKAAIGQIQL
jgi:hypothetical protein